MNEAELDELVVTMSGDSAEYEDMLENAVKLSKDAASQVEESGNRMEEAGGKLKEFWKGAVETIAGWGALEFLKGAKEEWNQAETAAFKLSAVIKGQGEDVAVLSKEYADFATEIQKASTFSDEQVLALLKTAETFDLTGESAKKAARDAMALAKVSDVSAEGAIRLTAAMAKGDIEAAMMFKRMIGPLRGVKDEEAFLEKYQRLITSGMETMAGELQTGAGRAENFKNLYSDMLEEIGKVFAEIPNPVKILKKEAIAVWNSMDEGTKRVVVQAAALTAALLGVLGVITLIGTVFNVSFGGIGIIIGLIVTGTVALSAWAETVGGLGAVWDMVKEKAQAAWAWLKPVRQALASFFQSIWDTAKKVWADIKEFISSTWDSLVGDTAVDWETIRQTIVDAILLAQFIFENFGEVMSLVWKKAKLDAIVFADTIIHFFQNQLPAIGEYFYDNFSTIMDELVFLGVQLTSAWHDTFAALFPWLLESFKEVVTKMASLGMDLAERITKSILLLPSLVKGEVKMSDIWGDFGKDFNLQLKEINFQAIADRFKKIQFNLPQLLLPEREIGKLEKSLRDEFNAAAEALGESWDEFRKRKLEEFAQEVPPGVEEAAKAAGDEINDELGKGAKKATEKVDSALAQSAEAVSRLAQFRDDQLEPNKKGAGGGGNLQKFDAAGVGSAEANARKEEKDLLGRIARATERQASKPTVEVEETDLEG